jgi:MscS family membrane protein
MIRFAFAVLSGLALSTAAPAQSLVGSSPTPVSPQDLVPEVSPDSPRASIQEYLDACRAGQFDEAAKFLDLDNGMQARGADLARRLKDVLDRHLWIDFNRLSPLAEGDLNDGLGPESERLGSVPGPTGRNEPVRLERRRQGDHVRWVFSAATVARIDTWYDALGGRWVHEHLPAALLRPGPKELLWWQWLALIPLAVVAWMIGRIAGVLTRRVLARITSRTQSEWDDRLIQRLSGPLTFGWSLVISGFLVGPLDLYPPAETFLVRLIRALGLIVAFWALWRVVDLAAAAAQSLPSLQDRPSARSLLGLGERFGKVMVAVVGVVAALSELGYPVTSLVAGLGLGGLAFALAAQKTVENLFGSISLAVDEPFRVGDFVRIDDFVGTIEAIGLRSTRIRTLDRTLITLPNGRLADMRLESFTARDRIRLACTISLVYSTTAAQMREVLAGLERVLRAHPKIWPDAVVVRFKELGSSSLDIEIMAWFETPDWGEFQLIRQDILIQFMEVVERAGSDFAFPTQTLHLEGRVESGA